MSRPMSCDDPREVLASNPMSALQIAAIAITVGLNALDGFDVLAISFAAPGIAREFGIERAALGFVLSMELFGMGLGSLVLGGVADRWGRRRTLLGCLLAMSLGMLMAAQSHDLISLCVWRVFTGLGIGGMLATTNAVTAEFSNARRLSLNVSLMVIGYPVGAVVGGAIAALLLEQGNWRPVFWFGAAATATFIPLVYALVPESIAWLCLRQPAGALPVVNRTLARMRHPPVAALPAVSIQVQKRSVTAIFSPVFARTTVLLSLAYFLHLISFYFVIKWVPKIVVDLGFTPSAAAGVLVWANVGGAAGGLILGLLSLRVGMKPLTRVVLVCSTVMLVIFGRGYHTLASLSLVCGLAGFFTNAGIVGLYGILAQGFPADLRATGTGFAVGTGRAGSILAPILGGLLFQAGFGLQIVALAMGAGSLAAALALSLLPDRG